MPKSKTGVSKRTTLQDFAGFDRDVGRADRWRGAIRPQHREKPGNVLTIVGGGKVFLPPSERVGKKSLLPGEKCLRCKLRVSILIQRAPHPQPGLLHHMRINL